MPHSNEQVFEPTPLTVLEDRVDGVPFAVLIDNNYLIRTYNAKQFGVDFTRFRTLMMNLPGHLHSISVFVATLPNNDQEGFLTFLNRSGFNGIACPVTEYRNTKDDNETTITRRTTLETLFVTQAMKLADSVKHFIIIADNRIYTTAFRAMIEKGATLTFMLDDDWSKSMNDVANVVVNFLDPTIADNIKKLTT